VLGARSGYTAASSRAGRRPTPVVGGTPDRRRCCRRCPGCWTAPPEGPPSGPMPGTVLTSAGVLVTALTAREFGGNRRAQVLGAAVYAGSAFVLAPATCCPPPRWTRSFWAGLWHSAGALARTGDKPAARCSGWSPPSRCRRVPDPGSSGGARGGTAFSPSTRELPPGPAVGGPAVRPCSRHPRARLTGPTRLAVALARPTIDATAVGPTTFLPLLLLAAGLFAGAAGVCYGVCGCCAATSCAATHSWAERRSGVFAVFLALGFRALPGGRAVPGAVGGGRRGEVVRHPPPRNWRAGQLAGAGGVRAARTARARPGLPGGRAGELATHPTGLAQPGRRIGGHRGRPPNRAPDNDAGCCVRRDGGPGLAGAATGVPAERGDRHQGHVGRRPPWNASARTWTCRRCIARSSITGSSASPARRRRGALRGRPGRHPAVLRRVAAGRQGARGGARGYGVPSGTPLWLASTGTPRGRCCGRHCVTS